MIENIIQLIKDAKNLENEKTILQFWSKNENLKLLQQGLNLNKKSELEVFYELFDEYIGKLRNRYFLYTDNINNVYKNLIKVDINLIIKLKKRGLKNFYKYFKGTYTYYNLKAIESYRFTNNLNKLSEELLSVKEKLLNYLVKSYNLKPNKQALDILKGYFDRLFSTPEYISIDSRKDLIEDIFKKIDNFNYFYKIKDFKKYIDNFIIDIEIPQEIEIRYFEKEKVKTGDTQKEKIKTEKKTKEKIKEDPNRENYNIGLIFGDKKSYKSFIKFLEKNKDFFIELGFSENYFTQFEVIETEFKKQNKIDVSNLKNRLLGLGKELSFILIFEMDHETKLMNLLNDEEFNWRITVNNKPGQHFSTNSFKNMLLEGLGKYERINKLQITN